MRVTKVSLTGQIFIGLFLGIFVGWLFPNLGLEARPLSNLFLNLIKSIIAPLIFATLVVGISGTGSIKQVGRIGAKAFIYFEVVTTLALVIGLTVVNLAKPGVGVKIPSPSAAAPPAAAPEKISAEKILEHVVPKSFFDAAARSFSVGLSGATASTPRRSRLT